jgi:hypothetical protein
LLDNFKAASDSLCRGRTSANPARRAYFGREQRLDLWQTWDSAVRASIPIHA